MDDIAKETVSGCQGLLLFFSYETPTDGTCKYFGKMEEDEIFFSLQIRDKLKTKLKINLS